MKTWSYLILGPDSEPILVDTGAASPEIMETSGCGIEKKEMTLDEPAREARREDGRRALDPPHASPHRPCGAGRPFPNATVITNRRELEYSASGIMGGQYPAEYVKHHIDRLHTPGAMRLLDLELSGPDEILPGSSARPPAATPRAR